MEEIREVTGITEPDKFEELSDGELRDIAARASHILDQRVNERRKNAVDEIRRLARQNGLSVNIKQPSGKRGRSRKANSQPGEEKESA